MKRYSNIKSTFEDNLVYSSKEKLFYFDGKKLNVFGNGILSFVNANPDDISKRVSSFYNEIQFPNYEDMEDYASIYDKGRKNGFSKQLDDEIGWGSRILELGCGTGQLSLFLGRGKREVHAVDISPASLILAEDFRERHDIKNVYFLHMDVFDMRYKSETFDFAISNGVLHHTKDARAAFKCLVDVTKTRGYIIIGLYHKYGRVFTKIKQQLAKVIGENVSYFDSVSRKLNSPKKRKAWIRDQFFNPHETSHTPSEVLSWFDESNVEFINLLPHFYESNKPLLQKRDEKELSIVDDFLMAFNRSQITEGGFFVMVGKKK